MKKIKDFAGKLLALWFCVGSALGAGGLLAIWLLPYAYEVRGYFAVGGEWILILGAIAATGCLLRKYVFGR